jgi:hypothetical protein
MKGFMHVVEILLVIVLVFLAFAEFAAIPTISEEWSKTKLQIMANDVLRAFEAKGVDWFDRAALEAEFNKTLSENIIYSVTLKNVIKPEIKIGCLCNDTDFARVQAILSPGWFAINGINTSFELVQITDANKTFSLDFDVALIYGYRDLSGYYYYPLRNFLGYDKGVVEISDQPAIDNVQKSIFGLNASPIPSDDSGIIFSPSSLETGRETNKIHDYFSHIPSFYDSFENLDQWAGSGSVSQGTGNPAPSANISGNGCFSDSNFMYTKYFGSFKTGEIDFDVYLTSGSSLFMAFGKSADYDYLASLSSNLSSGYDAFYQRPPLQAMGTNASHLSEAAKWHHIKIAADAGGLALYDNGEKVASAQAANLLPSNITLYNKCGDAYVDNARVTYSETEFGNFLNQENTTQLNNDPNKILLVQKVQKGTGLPACVINYNIEGIGRGRTAWVSNAPAADDYGTLVKALVAWAAGNEYRVIKADIKNPVSSYIYKSLGNEMMQNAKITLELGYLY